MIRIALLLVSCFSIVVADAQDYNDELEKRNGFKDIILGTPVDSVKGAEFKKDFKEKKEFDAKLYVVDHPDYEHIGEVRVKRLELRAYKGLIYRIDVIAEKDPRLMKGLEQLYGRAKYIIPTDSYNWVAESLSLIFKDHSRKKIMLTYRSYPVIRQMLADRGKKIDEIAADF